MNIQIVTDSTCDLPAEILARYPITVIPCYININGKSYLDGIELSRVEFYNQLPNADPAPTTSAPGPGTFLKTYQELAKQGADVIFSIHITKHFSNICNVAGLAAEEELPIPVHVIDSGNLTLAEGLIALQAAKAVLDGMDETQVMQVIRYSIQNAYAFAKLDTVDYLHRSGRLSAIQHGMISLLDIKPILKMNAGLAKMDVVRTKMKAFARVLDTAMRKYPRSILFGVSHANAADQAVEIVTKLRQAFPQSTIPFISEVTPALGSHVGPGALCLSWIEAE